ncbi:serine/threonine-protein kinase [Streptomyces sp. BI20]|uniref:serine/threonine-protein kinase n=1 Tax=Streptomyces sp. BI20 TaxID=3403460 RepID=UPI003C70C1BC
MERLAREDPPRVGPYVLLARLGAGGMGVVHLARSPGGRTVVVKRVHHALAAQEEFRARFRREITASTRAAGRRTAPVVDHDTEAEVPWFVTEYVPGISLREVFRLGFGPLPPDSVRVLAAGLAEALTEIHAADVIHRDLKPSNVLVTVDGPRVIDFGIARALDGENTVLTGAGLVIGSPSHMAPEQLRGESLTAACDVFCLGTVLAHAASGRLPFGAFRSLAGPGEILDRIDAGTPDLGDIPADLRELIADCLHRDPARRPTPAEIATRATVQLPVPTDARPEPWLPAPLLAHLVAEVAQILATDSPLAPGTPAAGAVGGATGGPDAGPAASPTLTAHPPAHHGHAAPPPGSGVGPGTRTPSASPVSSAPSTPSVPAPDPHLKARRVLFLAASVTLVAALLVGGTTYALMRERNAGDDRAAAPTPSLSVTPPADTPAPDPTPTPPNHRKSAPPQPPSSERTDTGRPSEPDPEPEPTPTPTTPPKSTPPRDPTPAPGTLPAAFEGEWRTRADSGNRWRLTLSPGGVGDALMVLAMSGADGVLLCTWEARLLSAAESVVFGATRLTWKTDREGTGCLSGTASSRLTLDAGGTVLLRERPGGEQSPDRYVR